LLATVTTDNTAVNDMIGQMQGNMGQCGGRVNIVAKKKKKKKLKELASL